MRVVYLDHTARLSGAELALARLLPHLPNVDAHVLLGEDGPLVARLRASGVAVEVLPFDERGRDVRKDLVSLRKLPWTSISATVSYSLQLRRRLKALQPDLVHTNSLKASVYGSVVARSLRIPVVWHMRDRIAEDYLPRGAVRLVRLAIRYLPQAVIANSKATLSTAGLIDIGRVIPSPVIYDSYEPGSKIQPQEHQFTIGILGRIAPWKGQDIFLRAFAQAFTDGITRAVIIGTPMFGKDAYEESLHDLVLQLGIDSQVEFGGFHEDVAACLSEMDVLVHASIVPEPFGQVIIEGMAACVPVIACNAGGPAEIIEHDRTGLLYPPGDVAALAELMERLASSEPTRKRLAKAAAGALDAYAPSIVAGQVTDLYQTVLETRAQRAALPLLRRSHRRK